MVATGVREAFLLILLTLLLPLASAELISLDRCGDTVISEQGVGGNAEWVMQNDCILLEMKKNQYDPTVEVYDKNNDRYFLMMANQLEERNNEADENTTTTITSMQLTSDTDEGFVRWTNTDTMIGYELNGRNFKLVAELNNWNYDYADSELYLNMRFHKNEGDLLQWIPVIVDGNQIPIITETKTVGQNTFITQHIGRGNQIIIDPIYQVDYSPEPAEHLINGSVHNDTESSFENITGITAGLSDSSDATTYMTRRGITTISDYELLLYYPLDETSGTTVNDLSQYSNDGTYYGSPNLTITGTINTGMELDGINDRIELASISNYNLASDEDMALCFGINASDDIRNTDRVFDFYGAEGFKVEGDDDELEFTIDRSTSGASTIKTSTHFDDNQWHNVCFITNMDLNQIYAYVDGSLDKTQGRTMSGTVTIPIDPTIGVDDSLSDYTEGGIDEICYLKGTDINVTQLVDEYENNGCSALTGDNNKGIAIVGHWNQTYDPTFQYFLRVKKTSTGTSDTTVHAHEDNQTPSTLLSQQLLSGTGWFNINVTQLVAYMTNNKSLAYTQLRFYTELPHYFSELYLRTEVNDTENPTVNSYSINETSISCLQSAKFTANITDNLDVLNVTFTIEGTNYTPTKNGDIYTHILTPTTNGTTIYDWTNIISYDILANMDDTDPSLSLNYTCNYEEYININHTSTQGLDIEINYTTARINWTTTNPSDSTVDYGANNPSNISLQEYNATYTLNHWILLTGLTENTTYYYNVTSTANPTQMLGIFNFTTPYICIENWIAQYTNITSCQTNNTIIQNLTYTDTNACGTTDDLPLDNGTQEINYCNYCDSDWELHTGGLHECQLNNTKYVEYFDNNNCYVITNLTEDEPPIDDQTWESCQYFVSDFNCTLASEPYLRKKMEYTCYLPVGTGEYTCLNTVSYGLDDILQVNPQRQERSDSIIGSNLVETREFFTTSNGILNAYYTNKNIVAGNPFTITTTCNNNSTSLVHQVNVVPEIQDLHQLAPILVWTKDNVGYLTAGFILILMVIGLLAFWFKEWRTSK